MEHHGLSERLLTALLINPVYKNSETLWKNLLKLNAIAVGPGSRFPPVRAPDIRTYVIQVARLAGFIPSRRQLLPGIKKLWDGYVIMQHFQTS